MSSKQTSSTVEIYRGGRLLYVRPFPQILEVELTFLMKRASFDPRKGDIQIRANNEALFARCQDDPSFMIVPAGFLSRIRRKLEEHGYTIHYEDRRGLQIEEPKFDRLLAPPRSCQIEAMSRVLAADCGICNMATATGKTVLIQQLCEVLPSTQIIITSHKIAPLSAMYSYLTKIYGSEVSGLGEVHGHSEPARITICHIRSLLRAPIHTCQILFYDEVHGAAAEQRSDYLCQVNAANMYGFTASPSGRLDRREPIIEALFGPIIYNLTYRRAVEEGLIVPVEVHIYRITGAPIDHDSYLRRQKLGIIANKQRNQFIAQVARKYADKPTIIVARDDLEHVFHLKQELPEFDVVYGPGSLTKGRWAQLKRKGLIPEGCRPITHQAQVLAAADRFRRGEKTKVICTSIWDTGLDLPNLEVVIRADGVPGLIESIQIPGRVTRRSGEKRSGIVVDFLDDFGRTFYNRSIQRFRHYRELGFKLREMNL